MPNPILRVGPFIKNNVFVDQPSNLSAPNNAFPINCANDTSSSRWIWRYMHNKNVSKVSHTGCDQTTFLVRDEQGNIVDSVTEEFPTTSSQDTSEQNIISVSGNFSNTASGTSNHSVSCHLSLSFFYQATSSFQIKINYNGTSSASGQSVNQTDAMNTSDTFGLIEDNFPNLNGSITRTLPAAVVPNSYDFTLNLNGAIDFPTNICIANPNSVSTSGGYTFEFL